MYEKELCSEYIRDAQTSIIFKNIKADKNMSTDMAQKHGWQNKKR